MIRHRPHGSRLRLLNELAFVVSLLVLAASCVHPPATASPAAQRAFYNTRVVKVLDLTMTTAQDASAATPPVVSVDAARIVTEWVRSSVVVVDAAADGWRATVLATLDQAAARLSATERAVLEPYFALVKTLLAEVQ